MLKPEHTSPAGVSCAFGLIVAATFAAVVAGAASPATQPAKTPAANQAQINRSYGNLPLSFEANQGQTDKSVRFVSRGSGYSLFLTDSTAVLALTRHGSANAAPNKDMASGLKPVSASKSETVDIIRMELAGASPKLHVEGADQLPGTANYFIGSDPAKWHSGLPTYAKVRYTGVYQGVDLVYYGNQRQLEYDFVVAPGADPKQIRLRFRGSQKLSLNSDGDLTISANDGQVAFQKPVIYQVQDGQRHRVSGRFVMLANHSVGFQMGRYDRHRELVVDPKLVYSSYLGGSGGGFANYYGDTAYALAIDAEGNAYVTGSTYSGDFPTSTDAAQPTNKERANGAPTAFVTKINADATAIVYSTYLGGTGGGYPGQGEYGDAIAVNTAGEAFVTGGTFASNFPVTPGAYQQKNKGAALDNSNAFVTKLNSAGTSLLYSSYLGGSGRYTGNATSGGEFGTGIAVDTEGDAYVAGRTWSTDFPTSSGALQPKIGGATYTGFVTEFNPAGSTFVYSTYLGGSSEDFISGLAIDASKNVYLVGTTYSSNFPVTKGALQPTNRAAAINESNLFVTSIDSQGTKLRYSTYLGGTGFFKVDVGQFGDSGNGVAVDAEGNAYVVGTVYSSNFPLSECALQKTNRATPNLVPTVSISKINDSGTALLYSTYLGGTGFPGAFLEQSGGDSANAIAVDPDGNAYVTGQALSTNFPITSDAFQSSNIGAKASDNYNAFITKINSAGSAIVYSTYLGGKGSLHGGGDYGNGIQVDADGNAYIAGNAGSNDFPVTKGVFQPTNRGSYSGNYDNNAFVAEFALGLGTALPATTLTITSSDLEAKAGTDVSFAASVGTVCGEATGTVTFTVDGAAGSPVKLNAEGEATFSTSKLTPGKHTVSASYAGDDDNSPSASSTLTESIYGSPATIKAVSGSAQKAVYGSHFAEPLLVLVTDKNGDPVPSATVTFSGSGLKFSAATATTSANGEASVSVTAVAAGSLTAQATVAGVTTSADFSLTATKAVLTVTAKNVSVVYGEAIPALTYTISGYVNGDKPTVVTGTPKESTTAKKGSSPGTYPIAISQGTLEATNYSFAFKNGTLTITPIGKAATPVFKPAAGTYSAAQSVTITDTTAGAVIYYTTNGATPTTASTKYTKAIAVSATETIKAIAVATGYTESAASSATYTIN
jgi:hypothetical protein